MAPLVAERMTADTDHVAATLNSRLLALAAGQLRDGVLAGHIPGAARRDLLRTMRKELSD